METKADEYNRQRHARIDEIQAEREQIRQEHGSPNTLHRLTHEGNRLDQSLRWELWGLRNQTVKM